MTKIVLRSDVSAERPCVSTAEFSGLMLDASTAIDKVQPEVNGTGR